MATYVTFKDVLDIVADNGKEWTSFGDIAEEFQIHEWPDNEAWESRLYEKRFDTWICWDTPVGKAVIFLDDDPVAISVKPYRKSDTEYTWVSMDAFERVRQFVVSNVKDNFIRPDQFLGPDTEIPIEGDIIGSSRSATQ